MIITQRTPQSKQGKAPNSKLELEEAPSANIQAPEKFQASNFDW
jgi:hypothetical protein